MTREKIQQLTPKRLFSVAEAAVYLGRTVCALRELVWAGKIPHVRFDRRIFLDVRDLDAFIERHKIIEKS
jgi:excisionase family DNA binding protein